MQRISKRTKRMIAFIMVYMIIVVNVIVAYASVPEGERSQNCGSSIPSGR